MYKFAPMLGPMENWPEGSPEWIERLGVRLQYQVATAGKNGVENLVPTVRKAIAVEPWKSWPVEQPCMSVDRYFELVAGLNYQQLWVLIDAYEKDHGLARSLGVAKARTDKERADENKRGGQGGVLLADNVSKVTRDHGNSAAYLLRRLARDHPKILAGYERGDFPSVRAAAKAAGLIKISTPLEKIRALLPKLTDAELAELLEEISAHQRRPEAA